MYTRGNLLRDWFYAKWFITDSHSMTRLVKSNDWWKYKRSTHIQTDAQTQSEAVICVAEHWINTWMIHLFFQPWEKYRKLDWNNWKPTDSNEKCNQANVSKQMRSTDINANQERREQIFDGNGMKLRNLKEITPKTIESFDVPILKTCPCGVFLTDWSIH